MRGFGRESRTKVFFHRQPVALMAHPSAPAAHEQKLLELMQAFQQSLGRKMHPKPDQRHHSGPDQCALPVGMGGIVKKEVLKLKNLHGPNESDDERKSQRLLPENGVGGFLGLQGDRCRHQ